MKSSVLLLLAFGSLPGASSAALPTPTSESSVAGVLHTTLTLEPTIHTTSAGTTLTTRALNGSIPGPTLRIKPGDTLKIDFENKLADQGLPYVHNEFSACDESNIHFHGLHVSGELPSDDVSVVVKPGESRRYETLLHDDHMPGTYWLHPHRHGSTALQVGGGASLAIIVEDPPGSLPLQVEGAPEILLVLMQMDLEKLEEVATASGDKLFSSGGKKGTFVLINGEERPTIEVTPGQWTRFRLVYAAWLDGDLDFAIRGCEMVLLAKDGVYINDFPRVISKAPVAPAGRADIMVRCMEASSQYTVTGWAGGKKKKKEGEGAGAGVDVAAIATVSTRAGPVTASSHFEHWTPDYPPYLADLRHREADAGCACETNLASSEVNGRLFTPDNVLHESFVGAVVERTLHSAKHPYHQHLFPFQLVAGFDDGEYYRLGDWHDTVQGEGVVRYHAADYAGKLMVHCHRLTHEDHGMMATELVHVSRAAGGCVCGPPAPLWRVTVSVTVTRWVAAGAVVLLLAAGIRWGSQL